MGIKALRITPELLVAMCKPKDYNIQCIEGLPEDAELVGEPLVMHGEIVLFIDSAQYTDGYFHIFSDEEGTEASKYCNGSIPQCDRPKFKAEYFYASRTTPKTE